MKKQKLDKKMIIILIVSFSLMLALLVEAGVKVFSIVIVMSIFVFVVLYIIYNFLYKKDDSSEKIQEQLYMGSGSQKTDELFSMIAHQWRQPLSAITASASALELKMLIGEYDKKLFMQIIKDILAYAQHLSLTINEFRHFFKDSKSMNETDFETVLKECVDITSISIRGKDISIDVQNDYKDKILTYENEFKQVVLNLLRNAQEAIVQNKISNGKICIKTYTKASDAILEVSDNGGGIKPEIMERIFDPYFSTKDKKNSTGLGLYMSKVIIQSHCKGKITCFNSDDGAVFRIVIKPN